MVWWCVEASGGGVVGCGGGVVVCGGVVVRCGGGVREGGYVRWVLAQLAGVLCHRGLIGRGASRFFLCGAALLFSVS